MVATRQFESGIHRSSLVLNNHYTAIGAVPNPRALKHVVAEKARIIDSDFQEYGIVQWLTLPVPDNHPFIRTTRLDMRAPEVIILRPRRDGVVQPFKKKIHFSRGNLWKRDAWTCQYCGVRPNRDDEITVDHVIPRSWWSTKPGREHLIICGSMKGKMMEFTKTSFENCVLACVICNKQKDNRLPEEAGMRLRRMVSKNGVSTPEYYHRPKRPEWTPFYDVRRKHMPVSWQTWLSDKNDELYWNVQLEP